jgi:hypothetical protein
LENNGASITLNRQQYHRLAAGFDSYGRLKEMIGAEKASDVISHRFEVRVIETNPEGLYVLIPEQDRTAEAASLDRILTAERAQIAAKDIYVTELLTAASLGDLRGKLGPDGQRGARFSREADLEAAATWVCSTMHGDRAASLREVVAVLAENMPQSTGKELLGPTPALLDGIHARIFPNAPSFRSANPALPYPSSVGGHYLLERIFQQTAEAVWPLPGNIWWLDVALFFMGAIGTVQGYSDGNKRAARLAYAIILLRGRHPFVAPTPEVEADLFQMFGPEESRFDPEKRPGWA